MQVRRYDPATDHDAALVVLKAGVQEQADASKRTQVGRKQYREELLAKSYDKDAGTFRDPETWYVADDDGQIMGVMRIMPETHSSAKVYEKQGFLLIQELDAHPKGYGAGKALLEEAKHEAVRRGRTAIVLQTPVGSYAHQQWYPHQGFKPWRVADCAPMAGMILRLTSPNRLGG